MLFIVSAPSRGRDDDDGGGGAGMMKRSEGERGGGEPVASSPSFLLRYSILQECREHRDSLYEFPEFLVN